MLRVVCVITMNGLVVTTWPQSTLVCATAHGISSLYVLSAPGARIVQEIPRGHLHAVADPNSDEVPSHVVS